MSPDLVIALARQLYDIEVSPARASELSIELERLGTAAAGAESMLTFDDGYASHAAAITAQLSDIDGNGDD